MDIINVIDCWYDREKQRFYFILFFKKKERQKLDVEWVKNINWCGQI